MEKRVLGKGLDALIPKKITEEKEFVYIPLNQIDPSKFQPRQEIDNKEIEELSKSIKEKGVIQPIVVRKIKDRYEIIAGNRRYTAAKNLGLKEIPAIIKDLSDKDAFIIAIIENLQRKNLNPIEEAEAFKRLTIEFGYTQEEVAKFIGKDKATVSNALRLLNLPDNIKQAISKGLITSTQARTLLAVEKEELRQDLFKQILTNKLSVREIENKVKKVSKKIKIDPFVLEVEEKLQKILGTRVKIFNKRGNKGKIVIEYYSLDDLDRILKTIK